MLQFCMLLIKGFTWILFRIPGILIGGTLCQLISIAFLTILLISVSTFLFIRFVVLGPSHPSSGSLSSDQVQKIFEEDQENISEPGTMLHPDINNYHLNENTSPIHSFTVIGSSGSDEALPKSEAYQCGWVYITLNYECPATVNIAKFVASRASAARRPPRSVFFCILRDEALFLHESEEKVSQETLLILC